MSSKKNFYFLHLVLICLIFGSCQLAKQNDFTKQKFTNLKPQPLDKKGVIEDKEVSNNSVFLDNTEDQKEKIISANSLIDKENVVVIADEIYFDKPESEIFTIQPFPENTTADIEIVESKNYLNKPNNVIEDHPSDQYLKHKKSAKSYFLASLICLVLFAIGIVFLVIAISTGIFMLGAFLTFFSFLVGYVLLSISAFHSKIYKRLEPKKFENDPSAITVHTLVILGMLLFGSIPFLIPFGIAWILVNSAVNDYFKNSK